MRKKRIAQWIWKEHGWERVVAIETVRNVLNKHGLWKRLSQHTMILRIKGWMVYLQTSMRGDLCVQHQVDYNIFYRCYTSIREKLKNQK